MQTEAHHLSSSFKTRITRSGRIEDAEDAVPYSRISYDKDRYKKYFVTNLCTKNCNFVVAISSLKNYKMTL